MRTIRYSLVFILTLAALCAAGDLAATDLSSIWDLWNVCNNLSGDYAQTDDIDLSGTDPERLCSRQAYASYSDGDIVKNVSDSAAYTYGSKNDKRVSGDAKTTLYYYRSKKNGDWDGKGSWERSETEENGYANTETPPDSDNSQKITINHKIIVTTNVNADQMTVESGGEVEIKGKKNNTATLTIVNGDGTDLINNGTIIISRPGTLTIDPDATFVNDGNLTIGNNCIFTIDGDITNNGTVTFANNCTLTIDPGATFDNGGNLTIGNNGIFIIDGDITNNGTVTFANNCTLTIDPGATFDNDGNLTIGNSGIFTIDGDYFYSGSHADGCFSSGNYTVHVGDESTITFDGNGAQTTGAKFPTPVKNLVIDNTHEDGVNFDYDIEVTGTLKVIQGEVTGISPGVQGYHSPSLNYLEIEESETLIEGFSVSSNTNGADNTRIKRQWVINMTNAPGNKTLSFYWGSEEDYGLDWTDITPVLYVGGSTTGITGTFTIDAVTGQRKLVVDSYDFSSSGTTIFKIGGSEGQTLPVELSAFNAQIYQNNVVKLQWQTQSETNVLGFGFYRALGKDLANALRLDVTIPATNTSQPKGYLYFDREITQPGHYYYWLESMDIDGSTQLFGPVNVHYEGESSPQVDVTAIPGFKDSYPNPFNPSATIRFGMDIRGMVDIRVYNQRGQLVRKLISEEKGEGWHQVIWDGTGDRGQKLSSGVYIAVMEYGGRRYLHKLSMLK